MSLLRFLKKPGGGESSTLLPTPQSSAEKAANDEVRSVLEVVMCECAYCNKLWVKDLCGQSLKTCDQQRNSVVNSTVKTILHKSTL